MKCVQSSMDPFMYIAATSGDDGRFMQRIRDGSVSIDDLLSNKTPQGNNVLHLAAEFKQIDFFKVDVPLDKRCPLFWAINKMEDTPMHVAARVGCDEVVDLLIENAKSLHIQTAGDQEKGPTYADSYKELIRKPNLEKHTALHVAARYGHRAVVTSLMKADPELCCSSYSTRESPLFLATCKGFSNIAHDILNNSSISPSFQGINGVSALHAAVTHMYPGVEASGLGNWEKEDPNLPPSNKAEQDREVGTSVLLEKGSDKLELSTDSSHQGHSFGVPLFHEQISREFKKFELHLDQNKNSGVSTVAGNQENVDLLIATLIATVTFTAAVAPPGGFNDKGKTNLQDNAYYRWFQIFNAVSFYFSFVVLVCEFFKASVESLKFFSILFSVLKPKNLIMMSLSGMLCAFMLSLVAPQTEPRKSMSVDRWATLVYFAFMLLAIGPCLRNMMEDSRDTIYAWIAQWKKRSG